MKRRPAIFWSIALSAFFALFGSMAHADDPAATPRRGFNVFPWLYRAEVISETPLRFDYDRTLPYASVFSDANFLQLRHAGADVVRAFFDPSPLLVPASEEEREKAFKAVANAVDRVTRLGLAVIVCPSPRMIKGRGLGPAEVFASPDLLARYADVLEGLARVLSPLPNNRVILEVWNEPPSGWGYIDYAWFDIQKRFVATIRRSAPSLPVLVTGDRGGGMSGLLRLDPSAFDDANMFYSFHYYEPMVVTHQGVGYGAYPFRRALRNIEYPPNIGDKEQSIAVLEKNIETDGTLDDKPKAVKDGRKALSSYYDTFKGKQTIAADFAQVLEWARRYDIPASRIVLGEFGTDRNAPIDTVVRYARDVREAAEEAGFAWIYYNYDPYGEKSNPFSVLRLREPAPNEPDADLFEKGLGLTLK